MALFGLVLMHVGVAGLYKSLIWHDDSTLQNNSPCVRSVSPLSPLNGAPLSNPHFILVLPWPEVFEPAGVYYLSFDVPEHWNWDSGSGF